MVKIASAAIAGAVSSLVSSPAELVMTLQQKTGKSSAAVVRDVVNRHGVMRLFHGLEATMVREALWCASYLALGPVITNSAWYPIVCGFAEEAALSEHVSAQRIGNIVAGLAAVFFTQPLDTLKTVMQGEALCVKGKNATFTRDAAARIWRSSPRSFFLGAVSRVAFMYFAIGMPIFDDFRGHSEELFDTHGILRPSAS